MSELKVNKISPRSGTDITLGDSADTITIPSGATLDASNATVTYPAGSITDAAISSTAAIQQSKISGSPGFRNIVINGDMSIAQRATSVASITTGGYKTVDRMSLNLDLGTWTQSQSTDVPTGQGFATSLKMDCTTANASPSAALSAQVRYRMEGQMLQYLKKGTANAESLTLSFWVKSNKTGTYIAELVDNDNSRQISASYTVDVTDTWEKKTITFPGDTSGAFDNDNAASADLFFWLGAGSNYTSGTLSTTWTSITTANRAVGQVNLADNTANEWYITGIQLEAGTTASDFEFLPVDVNLQRCQRYFEKLYNLTTTPGDGVVNYSNQGSGGEASWTCFATNNIRTGTRFIVEKRTTPTLVLYRGGSTLTAGSPGFYGDSDSWVATTPVVVTQDGLGFRISSGSITATKGRSYLFEGGWTASAEL
jgi:hypothetical protein